MSNDAERDAVFVKQLDERMAVLKQEMEHLWPTVVKDRALKRKVNMLMELRRSFDAEARL